MRELAEPARLRDAIGRVHNVYAFVSLTDDLVAIVP